MEEVRWERDKTPYIVFPCKKCGQYTYIKDNQKTKTCLRCGKNHKISEVLHTGELVYGMTAAVESVIIKQNELAKAELGHTPELRSFGDFKTHNPKKKKTIELEESDIENTYEGQFKRMLVEMEEIYKKAPYFAFEILGQNYNIPQSKLKFLFQNAQQKGYIIKVGNEYRIKIS